MLVEYVMRLLATTISLWIAVTSVAISIGGNVFQRVVVDPMWSGSPPESVRSFGAQNVERLKRFHLNPLYVVGLLCLLACPFLAWNIPALRNWLLLAVAVQIVIAVGTALYFWPINKALFEQAGTLDAAAIKTMVHRWLLADRIRFVLRFVPFFCLLRALSLLGRQR